MSRPAYAPTSDYWHGEQTAYSAGLSYFPDNSFAPSPLGDIATDGGTIIGGAVAGPAGAAAGSVVGGLVQRWIGGSAVDQQRQARVNYFAQLAGNGNVGAMQLILGGPDNVSGNEQQMWINAAAAVKAAAPDVYAAGQAAGPVWLVGSGDTATNYPAMKNYAQTWAGQHPFTTVAQGAGSFIGQIFTPAPTPTYGLPGQPVARAGVSPVILYGTLAVGAAFLVSRRRRS